MTSQGRQQLVDRGISIATLLVVVVVIALSLRKDGIARASIDRWRASQQEGKASDSALATVEARLREAGVDLAPGGLLILEIADYQCPFCRAMQPVLDSLLQAENRGRVVQVHFPLSSHRQARDGALASICAETFRAGVAMHTLLYSRDDWYNSPHWADIASAAGVADTIAFNACLRGPVALGRLRDDSLLAEMLGVRATPTFVAHRKIHTGAMSLLEMRAFLGVR